MRLDTEASLNSHLIIGQKFVFMIIKTVLFLINKRCSDADVIHNQLHLLFKFASFSYFKYLNSLLQVY